MPSLFHQFVLLNEKLNNQFKQVMWEEQFDTLHITFEGVASDFKAFFSLKEREELLKLHEILFKFNIDGSSTSLYNVDFITSMSYIQDDKLVTVTVSINKNVSFIKDSNTILFFNFDAFISNFRIQSEMLISVLKEVDQTKPLYIYLPIEEAIQGQFVKLFPYKEVTKHLAQSFNETTMEDIERMVETREDLARVDHWFPLPHYFFVETSNSQITNIFNHNLFFVSLMHISNKYLEQESKFIIRGQKNIELIFNESFVPQNAQIIYSIFNFSFGEKQTQDKLEITRNIITIYLHDESIEQLDMQLERMKQTIERHFSLYVQDKIKAFFDDTKDAIDLAHKYSIEAREAADKIATNVNTAILALITAVFSGIVILTRGSFIFLIVALGLHIVYFILSYCFNRHFALKKKKDIEDIYDLTSKKFSNIAPDEKIEIKEEYVSSALTSIDKNLKKYFWLSVCLTIFMIVLMVLTYFTQDIFLDRKSSITTNDQKEMQTISNDSVEKVILNETQEDKSKVNRIKTEESSPKIEIRKPEVKGLEKNKPSSSSSVKTQPYPQ